jgi:hypothetical protein
MKNFVSLNNFNDPLLASKDSDKPKKVSSPAKLKKSKAKGASKEKDMKLKVDREYKLGRRKKSSDKVERKKSIEKDSPTVKTYSLKEEGSAFKNTNSITSLLPSEGGSSIDRFDIIN